jgi:hypothetical protein
VKKSGDHWTGGLQVCKSRSIRMPPKNTSCNQVLACQVLYLHNRMHMFLPGWNLTFPPPKITQEYSTVGADRGATAQVSCYSFRKRRLQDSLQILVLTNPWLRLYITAIAAIRIREHVWLARLCSNHSPYLEGQTFQTSALSKYRSHGTELGFATRSERLS